MRKLLKLAHHRHTGKKLGHHHTSWPALLLLIALTGGILMFTQNSASAANSSLFSQTINVAPPLKGAVITSPVTGAKVFKADVTVSGTCDFVLPFTVISIYDRGSVLLGSTHCKSNGTFELIVRLKPGLNILTARTNNVGGEYGPISNEVRVTFIPPPNAVVNDLVIRSRKPYITYSLSEPAEWIGSFAGGTGPYTVWINWGDGTNTERFNNIGTQEYTFRHSYSAMKPFFMTIRVTDTKGNSRAYTFAAIAPGVTRIVPANIAYPKTFFETPEGFLIGIYGCYLLLIIMFGLAWYDARLARFRSTRFPVLYQPSLPAKQTRKRRR